MTVNYNSIFLLKLDKKWNYKKINKFWLDEDKKKNTIKTLFSL